MGYGQFNGKRHMPITPRAGSWASVVNEEGFMPKENRFTHSAAALARCDEGKAARAALWEKAETQEDADQAMQADAEAATKVSEAFWQDTKHINSRENCMRIAVDDIRQIVVKAAGSVKISRKVGKMMAEAVQAGAGR